MYHFQRKPNSEEFEAKKVVDIPAKKVEGWIMPELNGLMGDIVLSLDDKYLYLNNWLHGDVRQYNITNKMNPKLVGQLFLGGISVSDSGVFVTDDKELLVFYDQFYLYSIHYNAFYLLLDTTRSCNCKR